MSTPSCYRWCCTDRLNAPPAISANLQIRTERVAHGELQLRLAGERRQVEAVLALVVIARDVQPLEREAPVLTRGVHVGRRPGVPDLGPVSAGVRVGVDLKAVVTHAHDVPPPLLRHERIRGLEGPAEHEAVRGYRGVTLEVLRDRRP